jgi:hypothetical protein
MNVRSYSLNGCGNWEWNGDGWEADTLTTDGNWEAYAPGERCRVAAFDDAGELVDEIFWVPNLTSYSNQDIDQQQARMLAETRNAKGWQPTRPAAATRDGENNSDRC